MRARAVLTVATISAYVVGCGAAEARPSAVPPAPASARVEPALASCRIEVARGEGLLVAPEGREPFHVAVSDGALWLVPTEDERELAVEGEQPLRFEARARVDEQRLRSVGQGEVGAGAVRLVPGLDVVGVARDQRGLSVVVQLGRRSPLAVRGVELTVGPLALPCGSVAAEREPEPHTSTSVLRAVPGGELRVVGSPPLVVHPVRAAPAQVDVRARERTGFVPVWMVDRRGESARVVIAFSDGARVEGWVALDALRDPTESEAETVERVVGQAGGEPIGLAVLGGLQSPAVPVQADEHVGLASLRPGAEIVAAPGEGGWARSGAMPLEVRVRWRRGGAHAELLDIPGFWAPPGHAWVRRDELAMP